MIATFTLGFAVEYLSEIFIDPHSPGREESRTGRAMVRSPWKLKS